MTEKQKWSYIWRYMRKRMIISEDQAKHATLIVLDWLEKHDEK